MIVFLYIDPGTGSLLIQALIAGLLAIPFFFRRTIGSWFARMRGTDDTPDAPPPSTSSSAGSDEDPLP